MQDEKMTLEDRLRNPQWIGSGGAPAALNVERTTKDMTEAANENAELRSSLAEMVEIYWGKDGDGGEVPECIAKAKRLLGH